MEIRPLTLVDCQPWAALLALSFQRDPSEMEALLRWLDGRGTFIAWGAWEGDQLAAQYACLMTSLVHKGEAFQAGMSMNMTVHPDFRGQGLIKQVSKPVYEQVQAQGGIAGMGFSNAEGVKVDRNSRGYGYQVVGQMQPYLIALRPLRMTHSMILSPDFPTEEWTDFPLCGDATHFHATPETIRHRYACHPFRKYQFGIWKEQGRVRGLVVYRPVRLGFLRGAAVFAAYGDDLPGLMRCWSDSIQTTGIHFAHLLASPASRLKMALAQAGFTLRQPYTRAPYYLTVKPLIPTVERLLNFATWDCSGGDII